MPDYYTLGELVQRWKVTRATLRKWISVGYLPVVKLSPKVLRVPKTAVEHFESRYLSH